MFYATVDISTAGGSDHGPPSVERPVWIELEDAYRVEKNWSPFIQDGVLYAVYSVNPHVVLMISKPSSGGVRATRVFNNGILPAHPKLSGSTNAVMVDGEFIALAHYYDHPTLLPKAAFRRYRHVVYAFGPEPPFRITKISAPFTFTDNSPEEFATTLRIDGGDMVMSVGLHDAETDELAVPTTALLLLLRPVTRSGKKTLRGRGVSRV